MNKASPGEQRSHKNDPSTGKTEPAVRNKFLHNYLNNCLFVRDVQRLFSLFVRQTNYEDSRHCCRAATLSFGSDLQKNSSSQTPKHTFLEPGRFRESNTLQFVRNLMEKILLGFVSDRTKDENAPGSDSNRLNITCVEIKTNLKVHQGGIEMW